MPLHLIKLCVGVDTVEELEAHVAFRLTARAARRACRTGPRTRMVPKRAEEILDGGSLYWVMRGQVEVRQPVLDIRPFTDGEGIGRCRLVLEPVFVRTTYQPRRAFQGWRYLKQEDAPADLWDGAGAGDLPPDLSRELSELGLL